MAFEGPISEAMELLEAAILSSPTFINQCTLEGLDPTEQVFFHSLRPDFESNVVKPTPLGRPFVLIKSEGFRLVRNFDNCYDPMSSPRLHIQDKYRGEKFRESTIEFCNFLGKLLTEIGTYGENNRSLAIRQFVQTTDPTATRRTEHGTEHTFWYAEYDVQAGFEAQTSE